MKTLKLLLLALFIVQNLLAQQKTMKPCGTDAALQNLFKKQVNLQLLQEKIENRCYVDAKNGAMNNRSSSVLTLPVVFHIVHNNGAENISDANVLSTLDYLNKIFAGQFPFEKSTNTQIQFCLAKQDPNGKFTTGITRTISPLTEMTIEQEDLSLKNLIRWNPNDYVNIWIVKSINSTSAGAGVYGYAYLANAHGDFLDGIVLEALYMAGIKEFTPVLAHEMGHYLNLYHTFDGGCDNNDCLSDGDKVCDTPPDQLTLGGCSVNSCNTDTNDKSINNPFKTDIFDYTQNFMDYSKLECYESFTKGQADRMYYCVENFRSSLLLSKGCVQPCLSDVLADFEVPQDVGIVSNTMKFSNQSTDADEYKWFVNNILQSTQKDYSYTFMQLGKYEIKLIATDLKTGCTNEKIKKITIICATKAAFFLNNTIVNQTTTAQNISTNASDFEWYIDGKLFSTDKNATFNFSNAGNYEIKLVAKNTSCKDSMSLDLNVSCNFSLNLNTSQTVLSPNDSLMLTVVTDKKGIAFSWTLNDLSFGNPDSIFKTQLTKDGIYNYCIEASDNGCSMKICQTINVVKNKNCELSFLSKNTNNQDEEIFCSYYPTLGGRRADKALLLETNVFNEIVRQKAFKISPFQDRIVKISRLGPLIVGIIGSYDNNQLKSTFLFKQNLLTNKITAFKVQKDSSNFLMKDFNLINGYILRVIGQIIDTKGVMRNFLANIDIEKGEVLNLDYYENKNLQYDLTFEESIYDISASNFYIFTNYFDKTNKNNSRIGITEILNDGKLGVSKFFYKDFNEKANLVFKNIGEKATKQHFIISNGSIDSDTLGDNNSFQLLFLESFKAPRRLYNYTLPSNLFKNVNFVHIGRLENNIFELIGNVDYKGKSKFIKLFINQSGLIQNNLGYIYNSLEDVKMNAASGGAAILNNEKSIFLNNNFIENLLPESDCFNSSAIYPSINNPNSIGNIPSFITTLNTTTESNKIKLIEQNIVFHDSIPYKKTAICKSVYRDVFIKEIKIKRCSPKTIDVTICNTGDMAMTVDVNVTDKMPRPFLSYNFYTATVDHYIPANSSSVLTFYIYDQKINKVYVSISSSLSKNKSILGIPIEDEFNIFADALECDYQNNIDSISFNPNLPKLNLGKDQFLCSGSVLTLKSNADFETYKWSDGSFDKNITITKPGIYWLKTSDECGIVQVDTVNIIENTLKVELGANREICLGDTVRLQVAKDFDTYSWSANKSPIPCVNCTEIITKPIYPTTYFVVAKKGTCVSADSIFINPFAKKANLGKDILACTDKPISLNPKIITQQNEWLNAKNNQILCKNCETYNFTPKEDLEIIFKGKAGTCKVEDTIALTLTPPNISLGNDTSFCYGNNISLFAKDCQSIIWKENTQVINCSNCQKIQVFPAEKTTYHLEATKNGCTVKGKITVNPIKIAIELQTDTLLCKNDTIQLSVPKGYEKYIWQKDGKPICENCTSLKVIYNDEPTSYNIKANIGSCIAEDVITIGSEDASICAGCRYGDIFLPTFFSPNSDTNNDTFFPQSYDCEQIIHLFQIFDRWGNVIFTQKEFSVNQKEKGWNGTFDGKESPLGLYVYFLEMTLKNGKKLLKKGEINLIR